MTGRGMAMLRVVMLGTALSLSPALAQDASGTIEGLVEMARGEAAGEALALPAEQLVAILSDSTDEQLAELLEALAPAELDALPAALSAGGAAPGLMSDVVSAALSADPEAAGRLIDVVLQTTAPVALPELAELLHARIDRCDLEMVPPVHAGHVLAVLSFDSNLATRVVVRGNSCDDAFAAQLAEILANITETADDAIASAIETALALEGGEMLRLVSALRGEVEAAALPEPATPPAAPPAVIGGGGASPGSADATTPGRDAIFAASGSSSDGADGGPVFGPRVSASENDVSPTN